MAVAAAAELLVVVVVGVAAAAVAKLPVVVVGVLVATSFMYFLTQNKLFKGFWYQQSFTFSMNSLMCLLVSILPAIDSCCIGL